MLSPAMLYAPSSQTFNWMEAQTKPKEKKVTAEELTAMQHNHQH
jgi:hypothetical protein